MKFFVPGFQGQREAAEDVWLTVRSWLAESGLPTSRRRIAAVVASIDGADHFIAVDRECPFDEALASSSWNRATCAISTSARWNGGSARACRGRSRSTKTGGWWILSDRNVLGTASFTRGVLDDIPYPMRLDERWRVVDFDEEVVGHA